MKPSSLVVIVRGALGVLAATGSASCFDPVHSRAVEELGDEKPGVPEGALHRPGQPCMACHGGDGPGGDFAFAGTVYQTRNSATPLVNASVSVTDSSSVSVTKTMLTNAAGNFFLEKDRWESPKLPLFVEIVSGQTSKPMLTRIGRNGGCGFCHYSNDLDDPTKGDNDPTHMPPVFLEDPPPP
jgi:hypothetical protein